MVTLSLNELLAYTDEEREKWRVWLLAHPHALDLRMQPDGRFATVGALVDHIFLVEVRHLARLQKQDVPSESRVATEVAPLFEYAGRWSIEETFQGSKTHLGFEEPQGWSRKAV